MSETTRLGARRRPVEGAVAAVFDRYPPKCRRKPLALRTLILKTAERTEAVGAIEETLTWGEPAYLTSESTSGSTIRLGWKKSAPTQVAIYFGCNTNLIATFRDLFAGTLQFEGKRSIVLAVDEPIPRAELSVWFATAMTYHRAKKALRS